MMRRRPHRPKRKLLLRQLEQRLQFNAVPFPSAGKLNVGGDGNGVPFEAFDSIDDSQFNPLVDESPTVEDAEGLASATLRSEVVIVDSKVTEYESLLTRLGEDPSHELVLPVLDDQFNSSNQIDSFRSSGSDLDAIHFLSHGNDNKLRLGDTTITGEDSYVYAGSIMGWAGSLLADADLLLYGCDVASTEAGQTLVESLAALMCAEVAVSDDLAGNESLGRDPVLECVSGSIANELQPIAETTSGAFTVTFTGAGSIDGWPDTYNSDTNVYFKFGDIVNIDDDANVEYVVIKFNPFVGNNAVTMINDRGSGHLAADMDSSMATQIDLTFNQLVQGETSAVTYQFNTDTNIAPSTNDDFDAELTTPVAANAGKIQFGESAASQETGVSPEHDAIKFALPAVTETDSISNNLGDITIADATGCVHRDADLNGENDGTGGIQDVADSTIDYVIGTETHRAAYKDGTANFVIGAANRINASCGDRGSEIDGATISNFVRHDYDGNGVQESGELGTPKQTIEVIIAGADDIFGNTDDFAFVTDASGLYDVDALPDGDYLVGVMTPPTSTAFTSEYDNSGNTLPGIAEITQTGLPNRNDVYFSYSGTGSTHWPVICNVSNSDSNCADDLGFDGTNVTLETDLDGNGIVAMPNPDILKNLGTEQAVVYTIVNENLGTSVAFGSELAVSLPTNVLEIITSTDPTAAVNIAAASITFTCGEIGDASMLTTTVADNALVSLGAAIDDVDASITDNGPHGIDDHLSHNAITDTDKADVFGSKLTWATGFEIDVIACHDGANGDDPIDTNYGSLDSHREAFTTLDAMPNHYIDSEIQTPTGHTFQPRETLALTITADNLGNPNGDNVEVVTLLPMTLNDPSGFAFSDPAVTFDAATGEITWDVDSVAGRSLDVRTITIMATIPLITADASPDHIEFSSLVHDDDTTGPDLILPDNEDLNGRELLHHGFDENNSFLQRTGFDRGVDWLGYRDQPLRITPPRPLNPIYSGLAEPGTTLLLRIYDEEGRMIGSRTILADLSRNWIASFPGTVIWEEPHAMMVEKIGALHAFRRLPDPVVIARDPRHQPAKLTLSFADEPCAINVVSSDLQLAPELLTPDDVGACRVPGIHSAKLAHATDSVRIVDNYRRFRIDQAGNRRWARSRHLQSDYRLQRQYDVGFG